MNFEIIEEDRYGDLQMLLIKSDELIADFNREKEVYELRRIWFNAKTNEVVRFYPITEKLAKYLTEEVKVKLKETGAEIIYG